MRRFCYGLALLSASLMFLSGCGDADSGNQAGGQPPVSHSRDGESLQAGIKHPTQNPPASGTPNQAVDSSKQVAVATDSTTPSQAGNSSSGTPADSSDPDSVNPYFYQARKRISGEIGEALKLRKTLVVWLLDKSSASSDVRGWLAQRMQKIVADADQIATDNGASAHSLAMAVVVYGSSIDFLDSEPVDAEKAESLAGAIASEDVPSPLTFTAVDQAADKFLPYRSRGYEMLFVIAANSTGHDWARLDSAIPKLRRKEVPVFGIGNAVPFYRQWHAEQFGGGPPQNLNLDSFELESIDLALPEGQSDADLNDSGYGPWGLERLCRETQGAFLRFLTGTTNPGWSIDADGMVGDETLRTYAPDYVSPEQYKSLLAGNRAMQALHNAALLPRAEQANSFLPMRFTRGSDEAVLARRIGEAQKKVADKSPEVDRIYDALVQGQADRAKITSPRWQAEFDLAMGRILAAKARIDGYNAQLAVVKQGKAFKDPKHTTWILQPSDSITAGSVLDKMAKNSTMYLNRVIHDHPGTPWAEMAQREMKMLPGWVWTEE